MSMFASEMVFGRIRCHLDTDTGRVRRMSLDGDPDPGAGWKHVEALIEFDALVVVDHGPESCGAVSFFVPQGAYGREFFRPAVEFPYERCADCGAEVHVSRLDGGLCMGCAAADAAEGR